MLCSPPPTSARKACLTRKRSESGRIVTERGWLVYSKRWRTGVPPGLHFDYQEKYWLLSARKIILYLWQMNPVGLGGLVSPKVFFFFFQFFC